MTPHQHGSARAALAARISALRKGRGMTQAELSAAAGITRSHISAIEHGRCNTRLDSLDSIARALGVSLYQLFDEADGDGRVSAARLPPRIEERLPRYVGQRPAVKPPPPRRPPAYRHSR